MLSKDRVRRALRTAVQAAVALPTLIPALYAGLGWLTDRLGIDHPLVRLGVAVMAGLAAVTYAMGWMEDHGYLRPLLRSLDLPDEPGTLKS